MTCSNCGCNKPDCCGNTPPYYSNGIQEEHKTLDLQYVFITALSCSNDFNMPAVGSKANVTFNGLGRILVGSYLWNPTYGYLKVTAFDAVNALVTLENMGNAGNAAPGTSIVRCTLFNVVDPPLVII